MTGRQPPRRKIAISAARSIAAADPNIQERIEAHAQQMVRGVFQFLEVQRVNHGDVFKQALTHHFIKLYIGAIVFDALKSNPDTVQPSSQDILDHVMKQFGTSKADVQEAVSNAFQEAMSAFTGRTVEYYCAIAPVPDMISKAVN